MVNETTQQRDITRLCIQCALLLLQHGAESMLVEQLSSRLGVALGMDAVESSISANAIVLTTIMQGHCLTSTRKKRGSRHQHACGDGSAACGDHGRT
ncbi:hypothetical protein OS31_11260 [Dickeya oryzae]